jgi:surface carbohydrate biosynthesis protein
MSRQDTIAISVENQLRELHGKIWLALNFLEAGDFRVILGEEQQLKHNIYEIAPDFLLLNSVRWPEKIPKVSEAGCLVASLNEEGNIFEREEEYFQRLDSVDLYEFVDLLFVPGQAHANIIRERAPSREDDVVVTGNPRFDLLQPELRDIYRRESEQLTNTYGRHALVNTNFVWTNRIDKSIVHAQMKDEPFDTGPLVIPRRLKTTLLPITPDTILFWLKIHRHDRDDGRDGYT